MSPARPVSERIKSQYHKRLAVFVALHLLIALHLLFWYGFGYRRIGAIDMQELFRNFIEKNVLTAGGLFFLLFIGLAVIWGRFFCGWLCHIGLAYDVLEGLWKKLKMPQATFPLRFGPVVATGILVWYFLWEAVATRLGQPAQPLQIEWGQTSPWELLPGWISGTLTLVLILVIMPFFLGRRPFCRLLCPWGFLFGYANRLAPLKVRRTGGCTMCGSCSTACPMDVDVSRDINTLFHVSSVNCTNCLQCVAACPTQALSLALPAKEDRSPQPRKLLKPLTYPGTGRELLFWAMVLVVGCAYAELYGIGIFLAFSGGVMLAFFSDKYFRVGKPGLKGLIPILFLVLAWAIVLKDGLAGYHHRQGLEAFQAGNFPKAQHHYELSDRLLWVSSKYELYHLYIIYKQSGQEEKRQEVYERYEAMRKKKKPD